jgi:hypothetical protein
MFYECYAVASFVGVGLPVSVIHLEVIINSFLKVPLLNWMVTDRGDKTDCSN